MHTSIASRSGHTIGRVFLYRSMPDRPKLRDQSHASPLHHPSHPVPQPPSRLPNLDLPRPLLPLLIHAHSLSPLQIHLLLLIHGLVFEHLGSASLLRRGNLFDGCFRVLRLGEAVGAVLGVLPAGAAVSIDIGPVGCEVVEEAAWRMLEGAEGKEGKEKGERLGRSTMRDDYDFLLWTISEPDSRFFRTSFDGFLRWGVATLFRLPAWFQQTEINRLAGEFLFEVLERRARVAG